MLQLEAFNQFSSSHQPVSLRTLTHLRPLLTHTLPMTRLDQPLSWEVFTPAQLYIFVYYVIIALNSQFVRLCRAPHQLPLTIFLSVQRRHWSACIEQKPDQKLSILSIILSLYLSLAGAL